MYETVIIHKFMFDELELKGTEVLTFAILYEKTEKGEKNIRISQDDIADMINMQKHVVFRSIKNLCEYGYVSKSGTKRNPLYGVNKKKLNEVIEVKKQIKKEEEKIAQLKSIVKG